MRVGDFSVEVVAADGGAREIESGHVLARPGQVYTLRLRNHGPLRAVADISIDGHAVTGGGLVLNAFSSTELERPIHATERGRFTVIAEGDERVFGPDGGRDNPDLGLIEARFRRELPDANRRPVLESFPAGLPRPNVPPARPGPEPGEPWRPGMPRWTAPTWFGAASRAAESLGRDARSTINALMGAPPSPVTEPAPAQLPDGGAFGGLHEIERAAGTGLTGASQQEFVSVHVGQLETEATVIQLRIVIGTEEALNAPRPLPESHEAPARPAARP
jgi:hypothetical protein